MKGVGDASRSCILTRKVNPQALERVRILVEGLRPILILEKHHHARIILCCIVSSEATVVGRKDFCVETWVVLKLFQLVLGYQA